MTDQKKKRVFSALLSGAIMFTFILVAIITYQLVGIFTRKNEIERLDREISRLETEILNTKSEIESWGYDWKIELAGREHGLHYGQDD